MSDLHPVVAAVTAAAGLASGPLVPLLIARTPEPEPVEDAEGPVEPEEPKQLYADIAAGPGLVWRAALACGVAAGLLGLALGRSWSLLVVLPLVPVGVALAVIDWRTRLLPTRIIVPTFALTVVTVLAAWLLSGFDGGGATLARAAIGAAAAFAAFFVLWFIHPRGMGYGDVRLSGLLGLALGHLGWSEWAVGLYGGFLLGAVVGGLLALLRVVDRKGYPFGPFMLAGALVGAVGGEPLVSALVG